MHLIVNNWAAGLLQVGDKLREQDKLKHFSVCFLLQWVFLPWMSVVASIIATSLIGLAKELWDQRYGSGFCWYDMMGNTLGIICGIAVYAPLQSLL